MNNYIFLAGRLIYALPLLVMGSSHFLKMGAMINYATIRGLPMPQVSVVISGLVIVLGALSVLLGFRGKIGAWLVAVFLIGSAFTMHQYWNISEVMLAQEVMATFYKNLVMAGAALMLTQTGTGAYSLDAYLARPRTAMAH
jgi:putative oxidoreductase